MWWSWLSLLDAVRSVIFQSCCLATGRPECQQPIQKGTKYCNEKTVGQTFIICNIYLLFFLGGASLCIWLVWYTHACSGQSHLCVKTPCSWLRSFLHDERRNLRNAKNQKAQPETKTVIYSPETNISPGKWVFPIGNFIFQPSIFTGKLLVLVSGYPGQLYEDLSEPHCKLMA